MEMPDNAAAIDWNDPKSFEVVYQAYAQRLYRLCYAHLQNTEESQEIVHDLFHSLWERRESLTIHSSVEHYLVKAAKLKVLQHLRNKTTQEKHLHIFAREISPAQNYTEQQFEFEMLSDRLEALTAALPTQCNHVFTLSRKKGLSNIEISNLLNITEKAVENQITRALRYLRKGLVGYLN